MITRVPLIAGNWKMHKTEAEAIALARVLIQRIQGYQGVEVLICPPFTALSQLSKLLVSSPILLGAQNMSDRESGAYTGEISARMVSEFCTHVILGHSERRAFYGEDDSLVRCKVAAARQAGLIPLVCVGESLPEREGGQAASVISRQLREGLRNLPISSPDEIIIAYEPVWAIGTGRSADPEDISDLVGTVIRPVLGSLWGEEISSGVRVLYGGSVNPGNASGFFNQPEIDGALVGGASLEGDKFLSIIERAQ